MSENAHFQVMAMRAVKFLCLVNVKERVHVRNVSLITSMNSLPMEKCFSKPSEKSHKHVRFLSGINFCFEGHHGLQIPQVNCSFNKGLFDDIPSFTVRDRFN